MKTPFFTFKVFELSIKSVAERKHPKVQKSIKCPKSENAVFWQALRVLCFQVLFSGKIGNIFEKT